MDCNGKHFVYRCNKCGVERVQKRRQRLKELSVQYKGGKCQVCGYNKCIKALDFHHVNPKAKNFTISMKGHIKSWTKVKKELDQCIVVCSNCHREIHDGLIDTTHLDCNFHIDVVDRLDISHTINCAQCNKEFTYYSSRPRKYCSRMCSQLSSRVRKRPSREQLQNDIENMNWLAIGRKYDVSDNAIRKWAKSYNLL